MPAADDDWRLGKQARYLLGAVLHWSSYRAPSLDWDHDHCAFCWAKFMEGTHPDTLQAGYATDDEYHWICSNCFEDFRDRFKFQLRPE
jgi:hypothetical protein